MGGPRRESVFPRGRVVKKRLSDGVNGNQVGVDPLLDPVGLQDHGGPTQTIALLPGSPAINAGSNEMAVDPNGEFWYVSLINDGKISYKEESGHSKNFPQ